MREELIQEIESLIPDLSEEMIVDAFESELLFDGYFVESSKEHSEWENARQWLQWRLNLSIGGISTDELKEALNFWKSLQN